MRPLLSALALVPLAACIEQQPSGERFFADHCAACHGAAGKGDGPLAGGLDPAPADLTTLAADNDGVFPRDRVMSAIDGYTRGTHSSSAMPEFGAGDLGDTVVVENPDGTGTPIPIQLIRLADYLAGLQG